MHTTSVLLAAVRVTNLHNRRLKVEWSCLWVGGASRPIDCVNCGVGVNLAVDVPSIFFQKKKQEHTSEWIKGSKTSKEIGWIVDIEVSGFNFFDEPKHQTRKGILDVGGGESCWVFEGFFLGWLMYMQLSSWMVWQMHVVSWDSLWFWRFALHNVHLEGATLVSTTGNLRQNAKVWPFAPQKSPLPPKQRKFKLFQPSCLKADGC